MNNQIIQWSMLLAPWLSLLFMKKIDIKRYMPVALFAIVTTVIIHDVGLTFGYWAVIESAFPFSQIMPYFFGTIPVLTMWIFKYTHGRYWLYMVVNAVFDLGFAFFLLNVYFPSRGIYALVGITSIKVFLINLFHASLLYGYHIWQEGTMLSSKSTSFSSKFQPAAAKPLPDGEDETNN